MRMMWRWTRSLLRGFLWLILLALVLATITAWLYVRRASPNHDGEWSVQRVSAAVTIERDQHGIPTIKAANLVDAAYALGVVHAQDRLWQLETHRRIGSGRLAEAFGEAALESDRFLRALGVRRTAEQQWVQTKGESRSVLEAYAAGVNDTTRERTPARPPEMLILGVPKEPWTPQDSLAWATMMAWDLGGNWSNELLRLRLALKMPTERVHELVPPYPGDAPLSGIDLAALYRGLKLGSTMAHSGFEATIERMVAAAPPSGVEGTGSNNWVVAGSRSATGAPLLANDPHLKLSAPALWYFVRIETPGLKVAGATMPGLPVIVLGQNDHMAWGFTNTGPDVQDLYLERLDPADASRYDTSDGKGSFEVFDEVIRVKGKPDVPFKARRSRHGPIISDAGTVEDVVGKATSATPGYAIAMRWTALDVDVDPVGVGLAMMRADGVQAFVDASRGWVAPMQSMVIADRSGRIGMVAPGRIPLRGPAHDLKGMAPAPGWDARYDWQGYLAPELTPREFDPPRGWIATANQRIHAPDYPHFITADWTSPFRQQRIEHLLESRPRHSLQDLRDMHADVKSLAADALLPFLKRANSAHPLAAAAQSQLKGFDGVMVPGSSVAAIYWVWVRQLTQAVFADDLGEGFYDRTTANRQFRDALQGVLTRDLATWCDDRATPKAETCPEQVDAAFARALDELQALQGKDVAAWRWGLLHLARSEHRPFSRVKPLARLFELRTPMGGDTFTVNASRVNYRADPTTGERYLNEHGPSLRALYDVADPKQSRVIHSTGQSGLPWSPQYRDFVEPWARVEYVPLWGDGTPAMSRLVLKKEGG